MIRILHTADIQVKNRTKNLYRSTANTLRQIEEKVILTKADIFIISGDLFEYAEPTDSERKLIYNFLSRLVNIETLKELVIISGNHDLLKTKKENETNIGHNAIDTFSDIVKNFENGHKIKYFNESKIYNSEITPNLEYYVYALEDDMATNFETSNPEALKVVLFHDMLKEYVDEVKLPLRKDIYNKLLTIDQFPSNSLILAGDIHKKLKYVGMDNQIFYYPGSTQQHTHNEGDFLTISDSIKIDVNAEAKSLNLFEFNDISGNPEDVQLTLIPLDNTTSYVTIALDHKIPFDVILENIKKLNLNYGTHQTFIKVKSSNIFVQHELKLLTAIQSLNEKKSIIDFEYDKISNISSNSSNNKTIQNIIQEKVEELSEVDSVDSVDGNIKLDDIKLTPDIIDDLLLSTDQLKKLFKSVMDLQLAKITDDDIPNNELSSEILNLFETELNKVATATKRYKIKLLSIETNSFMGLDANRINLNVPGITKILGTNGIGKTTLYRMIRWGISGEVFEGMSKASVAKNNLLVFNKHSAHTDFVNVKIQAEVNDKLVIIDRRVDRKWKNNTTDDQKTSINWKDYIGSVDRTFKLDVIDQESGETKNYQGEIAEKAVLSWFGDTLDNIMFINHPKLESILHTASNKLNELILNFIGIDYLQNLENNLDAVKNELATTKPKKTKDDLLMAITDAKIFIKRCNEELVEKQNSLTEIETERKNVEIKKNSYNDKLIDLGNIPIQIEEKTKEISELNEYLVNFVKKEPKQKIEFTETQPVKDESKLTELSGIKLALAGKQTELQTKIQSLKNSRIELNSDFTTFISHEITKYDNEIQNINTEIKSVETKIKSEYNLIGEFINIRLKQFNEKLIETQTDINSINSEIVKNKQAILENNTNISNGVCSACNRPFTDDPAEFEKHKQHLLGINEKLEKENQEKQETLKTLQEKKQKINNFITKYEALQLLSSNNDSKLLLEDTIIKNCEPNINNINSFGNDIQTLNSSIATHNENKQKWSHGYSVTNDDFKIESYIFNHDVLIEKLQPIKNNISKLVKLDTELADINEQYLNNLNKIQEINDLYNSTLTDYQTKLNQNIAENKKIDLYNDEVRKHNDSEQESLTKVSQIELSKNKLETESLPIYTDTKSLYDEYKQKFDGLDLNYNQLQSDINTKNVEFVRLEADLLQTEKDYQAYLVYQKNNLIWRIYSKLIKNGFKEIVFEYYRTFLNNTLNHLLTEMNFKLFWNDDNELYMVDYKKGLVTYQPVRQSSGMETIFLGLSLIYTFHLLNVKNTLSHLFIDEISGPLNKGEELSYNAENYQELMVLLLSKFEDKNIFIVDHQIKQLFETVIYEVVPGQFGAKYIERN